MELVFERGDGAAPSGHALVYFRVMGGAGELVATYVVVPPIQLDLGKYVPPMFASSLGGMQLQSTPVIPLPPLPEVVESVDFLTRLAEGRHDDLVYAGTVTASRPDYLLSACGEAAQAYLSLYQSYQERTPAPGPALPEVEVAYLLMDETQMLGELAKLTGKLRYAVDGHDDRLIQETIEEMRTLGKHLGEKYRVEELVEAAQMPGEKGQRLSKLLIERCYKLKQEQYADLIDLEVRIRQLRGSDPSSDERD